MAKKPPETVGSFLATLDHPMKPEILAVRQIILGSDPSIAEGIKWNAPSFRTIEWFATFHLRAKEGLQVILHLGAKARSGPDIAFKDSLLVRLGKDRASVSFADMGDIETKREAFATLIRRWIEYV